MLRPNAEMIFQNFRVNEFGGVTLHFTCADPGPGQEGDYYVSFSLDEVSLISSDDDIKSAAITKLREQHRPVLTTDIEGILKGLVGKSITV
jgi:hypothetical protein